MLRKRFEEYLMLWAHKQKVFPIPPTIDEYKNKLPHPDRIEGGLRFTKKFEREPQLGEPLVSIITVSRNSEMTIERAIKSVLNQTYRNIEYIIVDGGSTDKTLKIIHKYEKHISYWISEPDKGISDAFNKGIAQSTGNIIGIINSDDWYCNNAVELIVGKYIKDRNCCILHAKLQYWDAKSRPYYVFSGNDNKLFFRSTINHPTVFVSRNVYKEIGLFSLSYKYAMDYEWLRRAKTQHKSFCYINKIISNMSLEGVSDHRWLQGHIEMMKARSDHGVNPIRNNIIFIRILSLTLVRKLLERAGLNFIIRAYRQHLSITKKEELK